MIVSILLVLAFLFFVGSIYGWVLEVFYRRFISSANPDRKWINPGFLNGPYLPLYGFSLCTLFSMAHIRIGFIHNTVAAKLVLFAVMAMVVTAIEFVAGMIFIRRMKIKLWDYENEWGNIKGIICPKYTFYWAVLSAIYYFLIHPKVMGWVTWLIHHLAFSFFMGFFYGIFTLDFWYSMNIMSRIRKFAKDNDIIVKYELLKTAFREKSEEMKERSSFLLAFMTYKSTFTENLRYYIEREKYMFDNNLDKWKGNYDKAKESFKEEYQNLKDKFM